MGLPLGEATGHAGHVDGADPVHIETCGLLIRTQRHRNGRLTTGRADTEGWALNPSIPNPQFGALIRCKTGRFQA
jgi:hypothetical protein